MRSDGAATNSCLSTSNEMNTVVVQSNRPICFRPSLNPCISAHCCLFPDLPHSVKPLPPFQIALATCFSPSPGLFKPNSYASVCSVNPVTPAFSTVSSVHTVFTDI